MSKTLKIENLHVSVEGKPILRGVNLTIRQGELHALMGPNGSGKSSLAYALMGHPGYEITEGSVSLNGTDLLELSPDQRARQGLFLAFQYPVAIPGVTVANFLRHAVSNIRNPERKEGEELIPMREFRQELMQAMKLLEMDPSFARRYLNEGFSGGEKKRCEILQLLLLKPKFAILDETDSGLDSDAVRVVSEGIRRMRGPETGFLIITHHERLLEHNRPDFVHIMLAGRIVETGDWQLAHRVHEEGYASFREKYKDLLAELEAEQAAAEAASEQAAV